LFYHGIDSYFEPSKTNYKLFLALYIISLIYYIIISRKLNIEKKANKILAKMLLERIAYGEIENQVFFSPCATTKINIIKNPSVTFWQVGFS
jgi:hypothetical protein